MAIIGRVGAKFKGGKGGKKGGGGRERRMNGNGVLCVRVYSWVGACVNNGKNQLQLVEEEEEVSE